jgi:hypothetical protein
VSEVTKTCTKCGEVKLLDKFGPRKGARDGKWAFCRQCDNARKAEWRRVKIENGTDLRNRERSQCKASRKNNPERHQAYKKKYREQERATDRARYASQRQKFLQIAREKAKKYKLSIMARESVRRINLSDNYVATSLRLPIAIARPLIPAKREQLRNLRLSKGDDK